MLRKAAATTALAIGLAVTAPTEANAADFTLLEPHTGDRPKLLELHAGFSYYGVGPAIGGRFKVPVVKNGFIPSLDNAVHVTFGLDLYGTAYFNTLYLGVGVPITMEWDFYFNDDFSAFADIGANIYFNTYWLNGRGIPASVINNWLMYGIGGRYHVNENMALMVRAGSPYVAVGIEFSM